MSQAQKSAAIRFFSRGWHFLQKPWGEKARALRYRWSAALAGLPKVVRLPFGVWWIRRNDNLSEPLLEGKFENAEMAFAERFLQPGMTVLDVGAHHGLYTLLASRCVGPRGSVFAFEPSSRERRALRIHLVLNRCRNVAVQGCALGNESKVANLFLVTGSQTGCNSLRPPVVESSTAPVRVRVMRLDDWLAGHQVERVDFVKLDVEGGELAALEGAGRLLEARPRPVILAEVQDIRTEPWGYRAKDILNYLAAKQYKWFRLSQTGGISLLDVSARDFNGNFVACPTENVEGLLHQFSSATET